MSTDMPPAGRDTGDRILGASAASLFSLAIGIAGVAVPLLALHTGYSPVQIGLLIALSAVSQLIARAFMGSLMRRLPDKSFVVASGLLVALSCLLLVVSTTVVSFALSQLLQGVARAFFWTGSQTHAVRGRGSAVGAIALVNFGAGIGALVGPALAGLLTEHSAQLALTAGAVAGGIATVPALLLARLPPFERVTKQGTGRLHRRSGVDVACLACGTAGIWRGLLNSYAPIVLAVAGQPAAVIGILMSIADASALLGSTIVGRVHSKRIRVSLIIGVISTGVGLLLFGPFAGMTIAAAAGLALSGAGAGVLQTLGPAMATESVHPQERGDAIATVGLFRAAALFIAPLGMAGMVLILPVGAAFIVAGALVTLPVAFWRPFFAQRAEP